MQGSDAVEHASGIRDDKELPIQLLDHADALRQKVAPHIAPKRKSAMGQRSAYGVLTKSPGRRRKSRMRVLATPNPRSASRIGCHGYPSGVIEQRFQCELLPPEAKTKVKEMVRKGLTKPTL